MVRSAPHTTGVRPVTIHIADLRPDPKFFTLYYAYRARTPDPLRPERRSSARHPERPHSVEWTVEGWHPGDRVDIELKLIPSLRERHRHDAVLHSIFHDADALKTPRWSWSIPYGAGPVNSGMAELPDDSLGTFELHYDILYVPVGGVPKLLDPGIEVVPDP